MTRRVASSPPIIALAAPDRPNERPEKMRHKGSETNGHGRSKTKCEHLFEGAFFGVTSLGHASQKYRIEEILDFIPEPRDKLKYSLKFESVTGEPSEEAT
jgi:hypothetical protein